MNEQFIQYSLIFLIRFLEIFINLVTWSLIIWIVLSWIILFRGIRPDNPGYILFSQIVRPILIPFRWARIGMIDLSVLAALLTFDFLGKYLLALLYSLL